MNTFRIALRNIFRHEARSIITLCAIAFGCIALIFVGGFFEDLFHKMRESYVKAHTGHLQVYHRGFFEHGRGNPFDYLIDEPYDLVQIIRAIPNVVTVAQRIEFAGLISTGDNSISCLVQGIEPPYERAIRLSDASDVKQDLPALGGIVIESGDPLTTSDQFATILGRGLAAGINAKVGDGLVLVGRTVGGSINAFDLTLKGIFFTSAKAFDDHVMRIPLQSAQQLLQTQSVQSLVIMLDRTEHTERVAKDLQRLIDDRHLNLEVKTWDQLSDFYTKTQALFGRMFLVLKIVIAIIVMLSIYNTMNMSVLERTREIGTIMALGARRSRVMALFLTEGAMLGMLGGGLGIIVGTGITWLVQQIGIPMPPPPGTTITWFSEPALVPSVMVFAFVLSLITALVSSWYPAYKASRLEVAQALRHTM